MQIIIHRVNNTSLLKKVPNKYGIEIDVRGYGEKISLSHDPIFSDKSYDSAEDLLKYYHHDLVVFNMKETGYEKEIIKLAEKYKVKDYFLLDVEFPYLYRASRQFDFRKIAVRYSEAEPIEAVEAQIIDKTPLVDWVWIDVNTRLPLNGDVIKKLNLFKTCLVCPSRWGRPQDISKYQDIMKKLDFKPTALMTSLEHVEEWERFNDL